MTPGNGQFGPQGLDWQDLCRGPLNIDIHKIYKLWASWFQRRRFLSFSRKSMGAIYQHGGHPALRTMTILINFQPPFNTRLHMKKFGPGVSEEKSFKGVKGWTDGQWTTDGE